MLTPIYSCEFKRNNPVVRSVRVPLRVVAAGTYSNRRQITRDRPGNRGAIQSVLQNSVVGIRWLGALAVVVVAPNGFGRREGRELRSKPQTNVRLFFKKGDDRSFGEELLDADENGQLRVLVQTKDLVVVYIDGKNGKPACIIPRTNLEAARIQPPPDDRVTQAPGTGSNSGK